MAEDLPSKHRLTLLSEVLPAPTARDEASPARARTLEHMRRLLAATVAIAGCAPASPAKTDTQPTVKLDDDAPVPDPVDTDDVAQPDPRPRASASSYTQAEPFTSVEVPPQPSAPPSGYMVVDMLPPPAPTLVPHIPPPPPPGRKP